MASSFIIFLSYWNGELIYTEATHYISLTRALLLFAQARWGPKLQGCIDTVVELAYLNKLIILPIASQYEVSQTCLGMEEPTVASLESGDYGVIALFNDGERGPLEADNTEQIF